MSAFVAIAIAAVSAAALVWAWRGRFPEPQSGGRSCPVCASPLTPVVSGPSPARSYEINACQTCDFAEATVHGVRSPLAYCPSCQQRSWHLELRRDAADVIVEARCHLCGHEYEARHEVAPPDKLAKVIPFRPRGRRG